MNAVSMAVEDTMRRNSLQPVVIGVVTLVIVYVITGQAVKRFRPPGAMTVIEAQAMDMNAMSAATPLGSIPVSAEEVELRSFAPMVTYTGTVAAFNDSEVYPRVTGMLTALTVYPGDQVRAGQVIARLDSAELASKANEAAAMRIAAEHDVIVASEEQRMAAAQTRSVKAKADSTRLGLRDAQAQITASEAMRDQAEREQEAAQSSLADSEANVAAMQADVDYWKAEISREESLLQAKAVSREEYDREKAQAKTAEAKLAQAAAAVRERKAMIAAAQSKVRQSQANIAGAKARLEQARSAIVGAQADLAAANTNAEAFTHKVMHQGAMVNQAAAQERTARIVRDYTEIRATQDGVVTERLVSPGTLVQPGTPLLKIKSDARVRLQASVAEADLSGIRVGSAVTVTKPRDPRFRLQTRVTSIFSAANVQTRTITVEALTPNPGGRLLPGEYIVMGIATAIPRQVITVPLDAIRRDAEQKSYVWTLAVNTKQGGKTVYTCVMHPEVLSDKPGKCPKCGMDLTPKNKSGKFTAHRAYVTVGSSDGNRVVVENGLQAGQQILVRGQDGLNEDDPVTPVDWGASGPKTLPQPSGEMPGMPGMNMGGTNHGNMGGMKLEPMKPSNKTGSMDNMPGMGGR